MHLLVFLTYMYHDARFRECTEMYIDILRRRSDAITKKCHEKWRTIVGLSLTTILQYTSRFWSRIFHQITMWQYWIISNNLLTLLQLIFTCSLNWYQHWSDGAYVMLLTSLRIRRNSWKGFNKMASKKVYNSFTFTIEVYSCKMELFWRKCSLTLILRRSRTETVWFYTSTSNKRAVRPKLYTKSLTRDLKLMYSRRTLMRISINL